MTLIKNNLGLALLYLAIVAGSLGFLYWSDKQDGMRAVAAKVYADCIQAEHQMSPHRWYALHGEYPTCPSL